MDRYVGLLCPSCGHVEVETSSSNKVKEQIPEWRMEENEDGILEKNMPGSVKNSTVLKRPIEYETRPQPFDDEQFKKLPGRNLERIQITNYFPPKFTPRDIQIELWNEIQANKDC